MVFFVKGRSQALVSADQLASDLIEVCRLVPRAGLAYGDAAVRRLEARVQTVARLAAPFIEQIPYEDIRLPSDKISRELVSGMEVEENLDVQKIWARALARCFDSRQELPDALVTDLLKRISKDDIDALRYILENVLDQEPKGTDTRNLQDFTASVIRATTADYTNNVFGWDLQDPETLDRYLEERVEWHFQNRYQQAATELKYRTPKKKIGRDMSQYLRLVALQIITEVNVNFEVAEILITPSGRVVLELVADTFGYSEKIHSFKSEAISKALESLSRMKEETVSER